MAKKGRKDKARKSSARAEPASTARPQAASHEQAERVPAAPSSPTAPAQPAGDGVPRNRLWSNVFIALFLAYQLAMPLRYYLGGRGYDERFSWRMFSTLRMQECKVRVEETVAGSERKVDLDKALQIAWNGMLERYRRPVVDKLLARRCLQEHASEVRYERNCVDTDGSALPQTTVVRHCDSGQLDVHEGELAAAPARGGAGEARP
jgi:hypothetical protein